ASSIPARSVPAGGVLAGSLDSTDSAASSVPAARFKEAEFARQQEELAQKAQAESVASPTEHASGMSDQRRRELDAAQLIYTEADWLDLLAKIATNSALSKQLLGDDVTEENMNERLGILLLHFVKNSSASVYNQGWTMKKVKALIIAQLRLEFEYIQKHLERSNLLNFRLSTFHPKPTLDASPAKRATQRAPPVPAVSLQDHAGVLAAPSIPADVSLPAATSSAPADIPVPAVSIAYAAVSVPVEPMVHPAESHMDDPFTAPEHGSFEPIVNAPPPSSSRHRRKHIAKKRVTSIVDVADAAMIKVDSDSDSDDDPLPYAPYRLLCAVDALYQSEEPDTFALLLWGDLHVLFQSLDDKDALHLWRTQDSWRIRSWRLYQRAQVHVLEMVDGRVIHMFVDVSYPLSVGTLERMLKHGLEVTKNWMVFTFHVPFWNDKWLVQEGTALVQERTALGKDKSNPLTVGSLLKTTWSSIHHLLTDEVLTSPEQMAIDQMLLSHDPAVLGVPAGFGLLLFGWLMLVLFMLLESRCNPRAYKCRSIKNIEVNDIEMMVMVVAADLDGGSGRFMWWRGLISMVVAEGLKRGEVVCFRSTTTPTIIQLRNVSITHSTSTSRFAKKGGHKKTKSKRGKNVEDEPVAAVRWLPVEEELLASCYVAVSKDNNVGRSQKNETFWYRVLNEFNSQIFQKRTKDMLTSKWHTLNANCQKFNAAYKRAKRLGRSGENDVDVLKRAQSIYRDEHKGVAFCHKMLGPF
nr:hypothetical protein [Tanacetum cinerariifolium]